jgi:hypothetical protein
MVLWSDIEDTFVGGFQYERVENTPPALPPGEGRAHLGAAKATAPVLRKTYKTSKLQCEIR